jgi:hypothetical protein
MKEAETLKDKLLQAEKDEISIFTPAILNANCYRYS